MESYRVTGRCLELHAGVVHLTPAQTHPRAHNLCALQGDDYEILRPVQFKTGEILGYDGTLPKALALNVTPAAPKSRGAKAPKPRDAKAPYPAYEPELPPWPSLKI